MEWFCILNVYGFISKTYVIEKLWIQISLKEVVLCESCAWE